MSTNEYLLEQGKKKKKKKKKTNQGENNDKPELHFERVASRMQMYLLQEPLPPKKNIK